MIAILDKKDCCGCGACSNICPHNCISMNYDEEGFLYPKVDIEKCIECHLCEKICPLKKPLQSSRKPLAITSVSSSPAFGSDSLRDANGVHTTR